MLAARLASSALVGKSPSISESDEKSPDDGPPKSSLMARLFSRKVKSSTTENGKPGFVVLYSNGDTFETPGNISIVKSIGLCDDPIESPEKPTTTIPAAGPAGDLPASNLSSEKLVEEISKAVKEAGEAVGEAMEEANKARGQADNEFQKAVGVKDIGSPDRESVLKQAIDEVSKAEEAAEAAVAKATEAHESLTQASITINDPKLPNNKVYNDLKTKLGEKIQQVNKIVEDVKGRKNSIIQSKSTITDIINIGKTGEGGVTEEGEEDDVIKKAKKVALAAEAALQSIAGSKGLAAAAVAGAKQTADEAKKKIAAGDDNISDELKEVNKAVSYIAELSGKANSAMGEVTSYLKTINQLELPAGASEMNDGTILEANKKKVEAAQQEVERISNKIADYSEQVKAIKAELTSSTPATVEGDEEAVRKQKEAVEAAAQALTSAQEANNKADSAQKKADEALDAAKRKSGNPTYDFDNEDKQVKEALKLAEEAAAQAAQAEGALTSVRTASDTIKDVELPDGSKKQQVIDTVESVTSIVNTVNDIKGRVEEINGSIDRYVAKYEDTLRVGGGKRKKTTKRKPRKPKRKPRKTKRKPRKPRKTISRKPRKTVKRKSNRRVKTRRKRR